jgi:hypothetical protein
MHVIRNAADAQHWAVEIIAGASKIVVKFIPDSGVLKKRLAVFCREDEVQLNLRE